MEKNVFEIPIKINDYEDLFNELDYKNLEKREIKSEVDSFIDMSILRTSEKLKEVELKLIIHLPKAVKDAGKEALTEQGIINHYKSTFEYQRKFKALGTKRIIYYALSSIILLGSWYYMVTYNNQSFISSLLNAGGTVLLWEIMSLIFIERKNSQDRARMNRKLSNMMIVFKYIE